MKNCAAYLDDLLFLQIRHLVHNETYTGEKIGLEDHDLTCAIFIPCANKDLSGITCCPLSKTLFAITNNPPQIHVFPQGVTVSEKLL